MDEQERGTRGEDEGDPLPDPARDVPVIDDLGQALDAAAEAPAAARTREAARPDEDDGRHAVRPEGEDEGRAAGPEGGEGGPDPVEAMRHWPEAWRERFDGLPDDAKAYVRDLHQQLGDEHARRTQEVAARETRLERYQAVDEVMAPLGEELALAGMDEVAGLKALVAAHRMLQREPRAALAHLARRYGIAPAPAAAETPSPAEGGPPDSRSGDQPAGPALDALDARVAGIERARQAELLQRQTDERQRAQARIDAFREARDGHGAAKHPHFERVRAEMGAMVQIDPELSLEDAYERALYADPELRGRPAPGPRRGSGAPARGRAQGRGGQTEARRGRTAPQ